MTPLAQRFWPKVAIGLRPVCWPWTGGFSSGNYGCIKIDGKSTGTHRVAFFLTRGYWPDFADHLCHNDSDCPGGPCAHRACCNPFHLEDVTNQINTLRGRGPTAAHSRATHCAHDHEFNDLNTRWYTDLKTGRTRRYCRQCERNRAAKAA